MIGKQKITLLSILFLFVFGQLAAQRQMENLDRGLIAVKVSDGVFASWRMMGYEWEGVAYNIYRDGIKINSEPLVVSNFQDNSGTFSSAYSVTAIVNGVEQAACPEVLPLANQYLEIPMVARPGGYEVNDATTADLDGDGEYEIIVKRIYQDWTVDAVNFAYFEAYKMDGSLMWEINVGPNIMSSSAVEINIAAFDFDEDGKAEVFLRTSEGTVFGDGTEIGDTDGDGITNYRYSVLQQSNMEYMTAGPEFLSLVDGETGEELDRIDFIPRISAEWWGDGYGHRANKFFFGAPYLDGKKPSLFIGRGIYTKTVMRTYDVVNKELVSKWEFHTDDYPTYLGQGNHNMTIADVDMDGRDEIVWGGMTVDDDGTGLYSTQLGHGDALHVGNLDPFRKGTEIWRCLEESPVFGTVLYDGATGEILIHDTQDRDCGRCMAANISDEVIGATLWGSTTIFSATTKESVNVQGNSVNFRIYWDGDLLEELVDHIWNQPNGVGVIQKSGSGNILKATGTNSCNWTKGTPTLQADLFGDWSEEVVWRTSDNSKIRIYTTVDPTIYKNYTLMHDHQYRQAICWQMCGYNQPPHASYFLGKAENIILPPPPTITNRRMVYYGTGTWDKSSESWLLDGNSAIYSDGNHVLFDVLKGADVTLALNDTVKPSIVTVNSPGNYIINANEGVISGDAKMIKQGEGEFTLTGDHDYTGKTEIWSGRMNLLGTLSNSMVWMNLFAEMAADGALQKGMQMRYGSRLFVGGEDVSDTLLINDSLYLEENAEIVLDLYAPESAKNDLLAINGDFIITGKTIISIVSHMPDSLELLEAGTYTLLTVSGSIQGNLENICIEGIDGVLYDLQIVDGNLVLVITEMREGSSIVWTGAASDAWDLAKSLNFNNRELSDFFVTGDTVVFNDSAIIQTVNITENVNPAAVIVEAEQDYTFTGSGNIIGETSLSKAGAGKLYINNFNEFTGKVTIVEGEIEVDEMPTTINNKSGIGPVSNNPALLEINGGILSVLNACNADRAVTIGDVGGTISVDHRVQWNSKIIGNELTKIGAGELVLTEANTNSSILIKEGTVSLYDEEARPGNTVIFEGGALKSFDSGSYSNDDLDFVVPDGQSGTLYLDQRCTYTGSLTGAGTFNVYTPWVRSDLAGDWSAFAGTINVSSDSDGGSFILGNTAGYKNSSINLKSGAACIYLKSENTTIEIGELTGAVGSYLGAGGQGSNTIKWKVGSKNTDAAFRGEINNWQYKNDGAKAAIIKTGSGYWMLTGKNTYSGGTIVESGTLIVHNQSGSGTGTGQVAVKSNAVLSGAGIVGGNVKIEAGGVINPGRLSRIGNLTIKGDLNMLSGAELLIKIDASTNNSDKITVNGACLLAGLNIIMEREGGVYTAGDEFSLVNSTNISGAIESISPESPGEGLYWDTREFISDGIIKVTDKVVSVQSSNTYNISIYPNPSKGKVFIKIPLLATNYSVKIENISGSVVNTTEYKSGTLLEYDLAEFGKGIYIISINIDGELIRKKCIVL